MHVGLIPHVDDPFYVVAPGLTGVVLGFSSGKSNMTTPTVDLPPEQVEDCIAYRREGAIGIIEFDNPDGGFITAPMVLVLDRITQEWESNPDIRAVILTGRNPGTFITHYSPSELQDVSAEVNKCHTDAEVRKMRRQAVKTLRMVQWASRIEPLYRWLNRRFGEGPLKGLLAVVNFHRMLNRWQRSGTVFIAAINGNAMGGGFEVAMACDFRLMARGEGVVGLPESISGILPGSGGTQRMARLIGAGRAVELILTGTLFEAEEAAAAGLVSRAVDADTLADEAMALALQMAGQPLLAVQGVKRSVHLGNDLSMEEGTFEEARNLMTALLSRDAALLSARYLKRREEGSTPLETFAEFRKGNAVELTGN